MTEQPYTPRSKKVMAIAQKEAKRLNHAYIGTEHLLLGILVERTGLAARFLLDLDIDMYKKFDAVVNTPELSEIDQLKARVAELEAKLSALGMMK